MESVLDFNKVCRACLTDSNPMKDLFSICSPEIFKYCTSVEISEEDCLPRLVCQKCLDLLNKLYYFKQVVIRSNIILKQHCNIQQDILSNEAQRLSAVSQSEKDSRLIEKNERNPHEDAKEDSEDIFDGPVCDEMSDENHIKIRRKRKICKKTVQKTRKSDRMKCVKCERTFQKYENLEAHMRSHFGKKPDIKCDHCDKTFLSMRNLNSHIRIHSGVRKYQCLTCGKNFAYLNVLKNHEMIHAGIKKHVCHICDAKFVQAYNLKTHLETHSNEKNYGCFQCGKKFAQPGNLKIHLIRHTGIKNIACELCDMKFYVKGDLIKHMKSHSADRPFSCEYCDKTFKSRSFKAIHKRTHTGERPYACDVCPKRFMARKDLRNHKMIHTGEKPHKCQLCNQAFIQKCALNRHMKGHAKNTDDVIMRPHIHAIDDVTPITVTYSDWHEDV